MLPLIQTGGGSSGGGGVTSFTGDIVVYNNSGSTGAVTLSLIAQIANKVFAGPSSGGNAAPTFRSLVGADLPNPSASTLGGIQSLAAVGSRWINTISTSGVPSATQPAFSDISGQADLTTQVTGVLPPANGGVAVVSTTGQGFLIGGFVNPPSSGVIGAALVSAGQKVRCMQMVVPFKITITKASIRISTGVAAATATVGIYSANGNTKLLDSGTFDASITTKQQKTGLSCTLTPGVYWFVFSASTQTTLQGACVASIFPTSTEAGSNTPLCGEAANSATSGVLPTTLGAITATSFNVLYTVFEP